MSSSLRDPIDPETERPPVEPQDIEVLPMMLGLVSLIGGLFLVLPLALDSVTAVGGVLLILPLALGPAAWTIGNRVLRALGTGPETKGDRIRARVGVVTGQISSALLFVVLFGNIIKASDAWTNSSVGGLSAMDRISEFVGSIVFVSFQVGDVDFTVIVFWLVIAAIVFTFAFKGIQFRKLGLSLEVIKGKYSRGSDPGEVTHFQALTSAVSGTVGLGNIAGVGAALVIGGPGATFWMILAGLLGMATKFVECTLGVKFREVHEDGTVTGGPFKYLPIAFAGLGSTLAKVATGAFAVALLFFGIFGGNMFQANQAYAQVADNFGGEGGFLRSDAGSWVFGIVLALIVGAVILGGLKSIGRTTSKLVPAMGGIYVLACLIVIVFNINHVPDAVGAIISGAFNPEGVAGGAVGVLIVGFQRAAFSNEAGVGSAPIAHSGAKTKHPVSEGLVALLEPFIDTVIVCTMTALTIVIADSAFYADAQATYQADGDVADGVLVTSSAFAQSEVIGSWFPYVLTVAVALFAFSTLITWSYYSMKAWTTLFGRSPQSEIIFKVFFCICIVIGSVATFGSVLDLADAMLFICAIFNLSACYILLPVVRRELRSFVDGIRNGDITEVPADERAT